MDEFPWPSRCMQDSPSTMPSVVKYATTGLWSSGNLFCGVTNHASVWHSDGQVWVWQMLGECYLPAFTVHSKTKAYHVFKFVGSLRKTPFYTSMALAGAQSKDHNNIVGYVWCGRTWLELNLKKIEGTLILHPKIEILLFSPSCHSKPVWRSSAEHKNKIKVFGNWNWWLLTFLKIIHHLCSIEELSHRGLK